MDAKRLTGGGTIGISHARNALPSEETRSYSRQAKSARHGCRVRDAVPVHTSILLIFTILDVIDLLTDRLETNGAGAATWCGGCAGAPISARGRPRGRQGYEGEKRQTPASNATLRQGLGWQGLALVRPRRASIVDAAAVNALKWTLADKLADGWQRTARGVLDRVVMRQ